MSDDSQLREDVSELKADAKEILGLLRGPLTNPGRGLVARVVVLEAREKRRAWAVRTAVGAAIVATVGSLVTLVGAFITNVGGLFKQ